MTDQPAAPHGLPEGFLAHNFNPQIAEVYRTVFMGLRRDAEARPGLAALRSMVAERTAYTFARLKAYDAGPDPIYPPDYQKADKSFTTHVQSLVSASKDDNDDDIWRSMFVRELTEAVIATIDSAVEAGALTDDDRSALLRRFRGHLEAVVERHGA